METLLNWMMDADRAAHGVYTEQADRLRREAPDVSDLLVQLARVRSARADAMAHWMSGAESRSDFEPAVVVDSILSADMAGRVTRLRAADDPVSTVNAVAALETPVIPAMAAYCGSWLGQAAPASPEPVAKILNQLSNIASGAATPYNPFPSVWKESVLVVSETPPLGHLLQAVLGEVANVAVAENADEAVAVADHVYLAAIVVDLDLADVAAPALYHRMDRHFPGSGSRFVFYGASGSGQRRAFLAQRAHRVMAMPLGLGEIRDVVWRMMHRSSETDGGDH